jgi:hypothetical protein
VWRSFPSAKPQAVSVVRPGQHHYSLLVFFQLTEPGILAHWQVIKLIGITARVSRIHHWRRVRQGPRSAVEGMLLQIFAVVKTRKGVATTSRPMGPKHTAASPYLALTQARLSSLRCQE